MSAAIFPFRFSTNAAVPVDDRPVRRKTAAEHFFRQKQRVALLLQIRPAPVRVVQIVFRNDGDRPDHDVAAADPGILDPEFLAEQHVQFGERRVGQHDFVDAVHRLPLLRQAAVDDAHLVFETAAGREFRGAFRIRIDARRVDRRQREPDGLHHPLIKLNIQPVIADNDRIPIGFIPLDDRLLRLAVVGPHADVDRDDAGMIAGMRVAAVQILDEHVAENRVLVQRHAGRERDAAQHPRQQAADKPSVARHLAQQHDEYGHVGTPSFLLADRSSAAFTGG